MLGGTPETTASLKSTAIPGSKISRRAGLDDAARLARLFAAAFAQDPVFDWLARNGRTRDRALQRFFYWVLSTHTLSHGETWMAADGLAAAAWIPPYTEPRPERLWDELRLLPAILALTGFSHLARGAAMARAMEHAHPEEPYFYLAFVGVAPRFQGTGMGTAVLEESLARVDAAAAPAFLENSNPRNTRLYERLGFKVMREIVARRDAPPLFAMWRPARVQKSEVGNL